MTELRGHLRKMLTRYDTETATVAYTLNLDGAGVLELNPLVGTEVSLRFTGKIACVRCATPIQKTYNQGHCYTCFQSLAECDMCIVKPHLCHFHEGTCRDEDFAARACFQPHTLYLARSSGIKIGITRKIQQTTRWIDQGATEACPLGTFPDRRQVGLVEVQLAKVMADKTDWRKMLRDDVTDEAFAPYIEKALALLADTDARAYLLSAAAREEYRFRYPVQTYPTKVKSIKLNKQAEVRGVLHGIKGQYLMFADGVLNLRAHAGYEIEVKSEA